MDPLSALSLAANVLQFVEFTTKILAVGHEIYQSGTSSANANLELVTKDIHSLGAKLKTTALPEGLPKVLTEDDQVGSSVLDGLRH